jgi:PAS domain S-box-containing protein
MNESIKILLIEDDTVDRIFFERALKAGGVDAELVIAEDAENGISAFCKEDFTCVFLDYMLPGTDGLSLLKKLNAEKSGTPIVLVTSHGDEKIAVSAMKAGALDYIPKNLITPLSLGQIIRNITRFKEIEKQKIIAENIVKQNEKRHRIFFEKSQIFLCTHDLQGNFIDVNEAGAKSLGYLPEELIGTNLGKIIAPSYEYLFNDYLKKILEEKTAMGLMRVMTQTGEERIWMYHNYLYEEGESENYVIGSIQDITERIKMEEEMRAAKLLAEESVKIKEQFLANMSHEIRTPMSAIIGFTRLILETKLSDEQKEYLDTINYSARNLLSIINDILDFSKIKSGKLTLEEADFDLSKVINPLVHIFQPEADKKNIQLICTIDPAIPSRLKGDSVRLNQILMNLFSNAIKFTETGSIKLNVEMCDKKGELNNLRFSVEDTGIGIPENKLESVFESFTQASSDTTRKYGGTGLGLAIVKDLVELHGGQIKAVRNSGSGTKFVFNLLLKSSVLGSQNNEENKEGKTEQGKYQDLKGARILLAEDNKFNQLLAKKVLEKMGCEVDIAENGKEAVEKLKVSVYNIVLMDIQMPEMDGYEATRYIRTQLNGEINKIPIIAMTAHALSDEGSKCILAGMNDYISKPFEPEVLFSKIIHLITKTEQAVSGGQEIKSAEAADKDILDLAYLKSILGDGDDVLLEVLNTLYTELPVQTENLKKSTIDKNWKQMGLDAHKMRSCIMMIGMPHFLSMVETIEKNANNSIDLNTLPALAEQTIAKSYLTILKVKMEIDKLQAVPTTTDNKSSEQRAA